MRCTKSNFIFPKSNFTIQHTFPELCSDKKRRGGRLKNKAIPFRLARTCTFNATIFTTAALPLSPLSDTPKSALGGKPHATACLSPPARYSNAQKGAPLTGGALKFWETSRFPFRLPIRACGARRTRARQALSPPRFPPVRGRSKGLR